MCIKEESTEKPDVFSESVKFSPTIQLDEEDLL